jgi:hypothetical protein
MHKKKAQNLISNCPITKKIICIDITDYALRLINDLLAAIETTPDAFRKKNRRMLCSPPTLADSYGKREKTEVLAG